MALAPTDLGANVFTLSGDQIEVVYTTERPLPNSGDELQYTGPEGQRVFTGDEIQRLESDLGPLVGVVLKPVSDSGGVAFTVLISPVTGVTPERAVEFVSLGIRSTRRGNIATPGADVEYTVVPLLGRAQRLLLPDAEIPSQ